MKTQQVVIAGARSVLAHLSACAFKRAWNFGKRENVHVLFGEGSPDAEILLPMAEILRARFRQQVQLEVHLFEPGVESELLLHPFAEALAKAGHRIATVLDHRPDKLQVWRKVIDLTKPRQDTLFGERLSEIIPDWALTVDGVSALVRSADAALTGNFDGLALGAKNVCEQPRWDQRMSAHFLTLVTGPMPPGGEMEIFITNPTDP